jgi:hypothetical protein
MLKPPELHKLLHNAKIEEQNVNRVLDLLLWFGFLGLYVYPDEERYSYKYQHNVQKMSSGIANPTYCIHPAFRRALGTTES